MVAWGAGLAGFGEVGDLCVVVCFAVGVRMMWDC